MPKVGSFPHPVLGWGDDVSGVFRASIQASADNDLVKISCDDLVITNGSIAELLASGSAGVLARVSCPSTFLRTATMSPSVPFSISIPSQRVREAIELTLQLVATAAKNPYRPSGIHADYGSDQFSIESADILAIGPRFKIQLSQDADLVTKPVGSIFRVREGAAQTGPFKVLLDQARILVELSAEDWAHYVRLRDIGKPEIHSSLVLPALVEALRSLDDPDATETLWRSRLAIIVELRHVRSKMESGNYLGAAQEILGLPFGRMSRHFLGRLDTSQLD